MVMSLIIFLILTIVAAFLFLLFAVTYLIFFCLLPVLSHGAYFALTKHNEIEKIISLADIKTQEKAVDLGCGDGRLVVTLAKAGAEAYGYEVNPFLVWAAKRNIKKAGLQNKAFVSRKNFWKENFSEFDVIFIFGVSYMMAKLEKKLKKELKPGARVVSNYFIFPNSVPTVRAGDILLYKNY